LTLRAYLRHIKMENTTVNSVKSPMRTEAYRGTELDASVAYDSSDDSGLEKNGMTTESGTVSGCPVSSGACEELLELKFAPVEFTKPKLLLAGTFTTIVCPASEHNIGVDETADTAAAISTTQN
jgi:hypothetical protein